MIFIMDGSYFDDLSDDINILSLLQRAISRKCFIYVANDNHPSYQEWLGALSKSRREAWTFQIDWSIRQRATHRIFRVSLAHIAQSEWDASPPRLTISDALRLVDTPFRVVLENGRYDRAFLLAMMSSATREYFEWLERSDQIIFWGAGGIGELRAVLDEQIAMKDHRRLTHWVLFDSDAPSPGNRSSDAERVIASCQASGLPFHCLKRRAIENYLPKGALYDWAETRNFRTQRRPLIEAFFQMSEPQRHHFHMKSGFSETPSAGEQALYAGLQHRVRSRLASGIDRKLSEAFSAPATARLREQIEREGSGDELAPSLSTLMEILRVPYG